MARLIHGFYILLKGDRKLIKKIVGDKALKLFYKFSDGFFDYYVCKETGEKKFVLDKEDILIENCLDDFSR